MNTRQWATWTSDSESARRAGGRRRYNTKRKRQMWRRRFAILQIYARLEGDPPHGLQQELADRFGVHKAVISRDVAWVEGTGFAGSGMAPLKCSYRRNTVAIEWRNPRPSLDVLIQAAGGLRALRAANRDKLGKL